MSKDKRSDKRMLIFAILALITILLTVVKIGFTSIFTWMVIISFVILFVLFFLKTIVTTFTILIAISIIIFFISILASFDILKINNKSDSDKIALVDCTSTINDRPTALNGWKSTIYSAALKPSDSPSPNEANNIRNFSYNGIKNKTEANSLYARIEKVDGSYITGRGIQIELCDANNKASRYFTTASSSYIVGEGITAYVGYLHGGNYLHGTGDYRADIYVKETDGKWHFIDRMTGIEITQ